LGFDNTTGECNRRRVCPSVLRDYRGHGYLQAAAAAAAAAISMFILYTYGHYNIIRCVYE